MRQCDCVGPMISNYRICTDLLCVGLNIREARKHPVTELDRVGMHVKTSNRILA